MLSLVNKFFPFKKASFIQKLKSSLNTEKFRVFKEKKGGDRVGILEFEEKKFVVKIQRKSRLLHFILSPFGNSKAKRNYKMNILYKNKGFLVPEVFGAWEKRKFFFVLESGYIEKYCEGISLREFLKNTSEENKKRYLKKLAYYVKKMHNQGIYNRDLTYGNMFVKGREITFIDVGRSIYLKKVPFILKLEDISKIDSKGEELKYFLMCYFNKKKPLYYNFINLRKKMREIRIKMSNLKQKF